MNKHAYLIIAHKQDRTLFTLLEMIDDFRNDIYIHMDIKCKLFSKEEINDIVNKSKVFFTERTNVQWGGYSQINAELLLLECATNHRKYNYYHLLSGEDLPIKSQNYIHDFFERNDGMEFVKIEKEIFNYEHRVRYYYLFQEKYGRTPHAFFVRCFNIIQRILKINRSSSIQFQKGSNWFSITDHFARYVITQKSFISKVFRYTCCCDEVFLQTILINSPFKDKLYHNCFDDCEYMSMRLIDWNKGNPYVWHISDYDELINSNMLFARKFDVLKDCEIIDKLKENIKS